MSNAVTTHEPSQDVTSEKAHVFHAKYLFPIATISREQLAQVLHSLGRTRPLPENVPYFIIQVPSKFNPLLIPKELPDAAILVKAWEADGVRAELV